MQIIFFYKFGNRFIAHFYKNFCKDKIFAGSEKLEAGSFNPKN
jgi:hypothetical protein